MVLLLSILNQSLWKREFFFQENFTVNSIKLENGKQTEVIELLYECEILVSTAISVSLFYPGDQQLPDDDVFSYLIWCTLDVNGSD